MSYYIDRSLPNGDRDDLIEDVDVTEAEPKEKKPKVESAVPLVKKTAERKTVEKQLPKIVIPKVFEEDWYNLKIETSKSEKNYYNAKKFSLLKNYADIVYDFYTQLTYQFNVQNGIIDMPEYVKNAGRTKCDLEKLAQFWRQEKKPC